MHLRTSHSTCPDSQPATASERGFALLGLIVVIFIIVLTLSVAAPTIAKELRREREVETVNRGKQYIRAIQLYYKKFGTYPGSIAQLEKTNNIRYLRQRYVDPMTGKDDWRIIPVGQNQTQVKWFFGQPLTGVAGGGLGSASGLASPGIGSTPAAGGTSTGGFGGAASGGAFGGSSSGGAFGGNGAAPATPGATTPLSPTDPGAAGTSPGGAGGAAGTPGSNSPLGGSAGPGGLGSLGAPFMGVGIPAPGDSIVDWNQSTSYATWEFLYDPRLDMMIQKAKLANGGGVGSASAGSLGQTPGGIGTPGSTPGAPGASGTPGGFGSTGAAGSFGNPTPPSGGTTPPQP